MHKTAAISLHSKHSGYSKPTKKPHQARKNARQPPQEAAATCGGGVGLSTDKPTQGTQEQHTRPTSRQEAHQYGPGVNRVPGINSVPGTTLILTVDSSRRRQSM